MQQSGDLRRDLNDGNKRLNDLEDTYWSHRGKDAHARDEQIKAVGDKLAMVERQVTDYSHELKEVQRDLRRAADLNRRIHDMEMRQDERRIREQEAKRGPKGATGERGPQGERGAAGKDGRDGHSVVLKTKNWETNDKKFLARETLSDGTRMPAINLRPMFEYFLGSTSATSR